jgi:methylase of polypeptide subunit release factors
MRLTELVHQFLGSHLREDDLAIDATAGNGYDTLELARRVGETGRVIAIDIQESAVAHTRARLIEAGLESRVTLHTTDHATQLEALRGSSAESVAAIVFNLGYLPGSDKSVQTEATHTLRALDASAHLLRTGGLLSVTTYRAHPGGEPEAAAVETWMCAQASKGWTVQCHEPPAKNLPPVLWVTTKP